MITGKNADKNQARLSALACLGAEKAPQAGLVLTHILGWAQGAEVRNLALSLGERAKTQFRPFLLGKGTEDRGGTAVSREMWDTLSRPGRVIYWQGYSDNYQFSEVGCNQK